MDFKTFLMENEEWKDIPGWEGLYQASTEGRIKSLARTIKLGKSYNVVRDSFLKFREKKNGYLSVRPCRNGKHYDSLVHRLIALTFIPNPENKTDVNHKNGDKSDNRKVNLEWTTKSENQKHAFKIGLKKGRKGSRHHMAKLTEKKVLKIRSLSKMTLEEIGKKYNVSASVICEIKSRKIWTHI